MNDCTHITYLYKQQLTTCTWMQHIVHNIPTSGLFTHKPISRSHQKRTSVHLILHKHSSLSTVIYNKKQASHIKLEIPSFSKSTSICDDNQTSHTNLYHTLQVTIIRKLIICPKLQGILSSQPFDHTLQVTIVVSLVKVDRGT